MTKKRSGPEPAVVSEEASFAEVVDLIEQAKRNTFQAVNTELISLYWNVGQYISRKLETAEWGEGVVNRLAEYIQRRNPNLRGFTRASLFRMRQFYETYRNDRKVAALLRQLPWTHHLIILGQCKRQEEREFYLRMSLKEMWSSRELERQLKVSLFERKVLEPPKVAALLRQMQQREQGQLCRVGEAGFPAPYQCLTSDCSATFSTHDSATFYVDGPQGCTDYPALPDFVQRSRRDDG